MGSQRGVQGCELILTCRCREEVPPGKHPLPFPASSCLMKATSRQRVNGGLHFFSSPSIWPLEQVFAELEVSLLT